MSVSAPQVGDAAPTRLLTADDVGARWQVPASFVYRLAREGKVPVVRLGAKYVRFQPEAIEKFEAEGGVTGE